MKTQWFSTGGQWLVLLPLWRRLFKARGWQIGFSVATGFLWLIVIAAIASAGGDEKKDNESALAEPTQTSSRAPSVTATRQATAEPTAEPTAAPAPAATPTPVPQPVVRSGFGQTATDPVTPPAIVSRAVFTHNGSSNFAVKTFRGTEEDLLINEIGAYQGARPIFGEEPVVFDIDADGAWTFTLEPIGFGAAPSFAGRGDQVSDFFDPPDTAPWQISHDGASNFAVWLRCVGGDDLVQNEIGSVSASTVVAFSDGPCLWEVEADGNWSLAPR